MDEIYPGTCILIPKPNHSTRHLWIVLTEPHEQTLEIVIANLTSYRQGSDTTVIIQPGSHSFVRHTTVVYYADARFVSVTALKQLLKLPNYEFHDDCSKQLLKLIQCGLLNSKFTPNNIKRYCKQAFNSA